LPLTVLIIDPTSPTYEEDLKMSPLPEVSLDLTSKQFQTAKDVPIKYIKQLRQNLDEGSTLEISYDLKKVGMTYKTATNLALFPGNCEADIAECAKILDLKLSEKFIFVNNPLAKKKDNVKHPFLTPMTVKDALEHFVDLRGALRKKTLKDLSEYCQDQEEKEKYIFMTSLHILNIDLQSGVHQVNYLKRK
jgi:sulfite reductase alpha subunit-like flavoprotein